MSLDGIVPKGDGGIWTTTTQPDLGFAPNEDPFVVAHGGFYRRWLSMIDDIEELQEAVSRLEGTSEDKWVPVWGEMGRRHEDKGDRLETAGDHEAARKAYLNAKSYYAIGRFPGEISEIKTKISQDCARAYLKACAHLDPPMEVVDFEHEGLTVRAHFRSPVSKTQVPAVLIMCGADVFKEDRGFAQDLCMENGMASLVMDGPDTGENPFPWAPESVSAWEAAIDYLASRPRGRRRPDRGFWSRRGGYSVMQLAGTAPGKLGAVVANAGHPFGYVMGDERARRVRPGVRNERATWRFGAPDDPPSFHPTTVEKEQSSFKRWAL